MELKLSEQTRGVKWVDLRDAIYQLIYPDFKDAAGDNEKSRRACSLASDKLATAFLKGEP
jgi:hypothetical protein